MGNLISIEDLRKRFNEKMSVEEWKAFSEMQNTLMERMNQELEFLKSKNTHLEKLLISRTSPLLTEVTSEEAICIEQIDRLRELSVARQLTLEEVKRLDLLVKNLKLSRDENTIVVGNRRAESLKESDLVAIATRATE